MAVCGAEFGLTGGIGAGKTTVGVGLVHRGAVLIDADAIVRDLQAPGGAALEAMVERFGESILDDEGGLDRRAVAERVFGDEAELKALNEIVHPLVGAEMQRRREALAGSGRIVVLDIPLLVAADGTVRDRYRDLTGIVVVDVDPEIAVARLVEHRGFSEVDARARIANQADRDARLAAADFVIDNSGSLADLEPQLDRCWAWMTARASTDRV